MTAIPQVVAARNNGTQNVHFIRKTIYYNDAGIGAPVNPFGRLPANSILMGIDVDIVTAFNAGTTNVLTIGTTTTNANELVAGADVDETGIGEVNITRARGSNLTAAGEVNLYAKYTQTGTAATAGKANVVVTYVPDNDG